MSQAFAYETEMDSSTAPATPAARRGLVAAWAAFAVVALILLFPFRYTAHTELSFDVAAQPAPSAVRGVTQLLGAREMAFDVVRALSPADTVALANDANPFIPAALRAADGEDAALRARAARTLARSLNVTAQQGGRALDIAVSLSNPNLAARVADTYAGALLALDASVRGTAETARDPVPVIRLAHPASAPRLPDAPEAGHLLLLAIATALLSAVTVHLRQRRTLQQGPIEIGVLPREIQGDRRVTWLRAACGAGLGPDKAVDRLVDHLSLIVGGGLVVFTSSDLPGPSATCALALARRLSETEDQVVLVALDGEAIAFSGLLTDPRAPGVAELLFGVAGFSEAIHRDPLSRAHLIPPGRDGRGGPSVVGADRLTLILEALRQTYGRVIVSAPMLAGTAGAERLAALSPILVALHEEDAATAGAVETYDALAAKNFTHVVMLPLVLDTATLPCDETEGLGTDAALPVPTLMTLAAVPASVAA